MKYTMISMWIVWKTFDAKVNTIASVTYILFHKPEGTRGHSWRHSSVQYCTFSGRHNFRRHKRTTRHSNCLAHCLPNKCTSLRYCRSTRRTCLRRQRLWRQCTSHLLTHLQKCKRSKYFVASLLWSVLTSKRTLFFGPVLSKWCIFNQPLACVLLSDVARILNYMYMGIRGQAIF